MHAVVQMRNSSSYFREMQVHNETPLYIGQTGKNSKKKKQNPVIPVANRDVGERVLSYVEVVTRSSVFGRQSGTIY